MPVVFLTGFNGFKSDAAMPFLGQTNTFVNSSNSSFLWVPDNNFINNIWGRGTGATPQKIPVFRAWGRKYNTSNTPAGFAGLGWDKSITDPSVGALGIGGSMGNQSDYWIGLNISLAYMGFSVTTSFRLGFRLYKNTIFYPGYVVAFSSGDVNQSADNVVSQVRFQLTDTVFPAGKEIYVEMEWLADTKELRYYVDDEMVYTTGPNFTTWNPWVGTTIYTELYNRGNVLATSNYLQFKDMYLQTIESEADIRLGSATRVWPFNPVADDVAQYLRPAGYNSNAAVAARPTYLSGTYPTPDPTTAYLSAVDIGQYDRYTTDANNLGAKLATVEAVSIRGYAANPLAGTRTFAIEGELNGTVKTGDSMSLVGATSTTFRPSTLVMPADPNGNRWTPATLAGLKIGTKFIG